MRSRRAGTAHAADLPEEAGLSRRVLRHLIISHDLPVGSRILDVGCGRGGLVHFLHRLGFYSTGLDENRDTIHDARRRMPSLDLRHGRPDELAASPQPSFDIVLVRECSSYGENLLSSESLNATAHLLFCLRPGGLLAFLARTGGDLNEARPVHSASCYDRHLAAFSGHAETAVLPDSYARPGTWTSLLAGRRPAGFLTATFQLASEQRARDDWLESAAAAATSLQHACCHVEPTARAA